MSESIRLYSFADVDRSGKVRWTASEIGLEVEDVRLDMGEHHAEEYLALNPYAQIPTVEFNGQAYIESTAICLVLAERHPGIGLIPMEADRREAFWQTVAVATTTLEMPVVNYALSKWEVIDEQWAELLEKPLKPRIETFARTMPEEGYLLGAFTLADIFAAYVLRIGIQSGLLQKRGTLSDYVDRLRNRPAAQAARFFDSLKD